MSFDYWSMASDEEGEEGYYVCYGEDATDEQKSVWGAANKTTTMLGMPTVMPETEFVAVKGPGKSALKLETQGINFLVKVLAAGSVFNGRPGDINFATMSADIYWGIPFTARPRKLEGYACYKPKTIDFDRLQQDSFRQGRF